MPFRYAPPARVFRTEEKGETPTFEPTKRTVNYLACCGEEPAAGRTNRSHTSRYWYVHLEVMPRNTLRTVVRLYQFQGESGRRQAAVQRGEFVNYRTVWAAGALARQAS